MVPRVGFEPTTLGLEVLCSILLSYRGITPTVYLISVSYTHLTLPTNREV